jgi:predicted phage tail protein
MRTIVLHGALAREFGSEFRLDVASPAEAIRALCLQLKGFRRKIEAGMYRVIRGRADGRGMDVRELPATFGRTTDLHVVPIINGRGSGWGKILAGVAIIALAIAAPYALGIAGGLSASAIGGASLFGATITFGQIATLGLGIALTGVAQMLAPSPKLDGGSASVDRRQSFLFSGQENVTTQGGPVPLAFGRCLVGSTVIAVGIDVERIGTGSAPSSAPSISGGGFFEIFTSAVVQDLLPRVDQG